MSKGARKRVAETNRVYSAWVLVHPADDLPGAWIAHALDFDVVAHGESADHALRMAVEAVEMVLEDDLADSFDPYARRAPAPFWEQLQFILEHGVRMPVGELLEKARKHGTSAPCLLAISMFFNPKRRVSEASTPLYRAPLAVGSSAHA
jgi:predicted RNase H-like HicB family nuclease